MLSYFTFPIQAILPVPFRPPLPSSEQPTHNATETRYSLSHIESFLVVFFKSFLLIDIPYESILETSRAWVWCVVV